MSPRSDMPAQVRRLAKTLLLPTGEPNKSAIARETGLSRQRIQALLADEPSTVRGQAAATKRPTTPVTHPKIGRPKVHTLPRRSTAVRVEHDNYTWIDENLPRSYPFSDFVNDALRDKIAAIKASGGLIARRK